LNFLYSWMLLATVETNLNNLDAAANILQNLRRTNSRNPEVFSASAILAYQQRRFDKGKEYLEKALTLAPDRKEDRIRLEQVSLLLLQQN
jgi:tetratricopeptide (TPR) repeat protein